VLADAQQLVAYSQAAQLGRLEPRPPLGRGLAEREPRLGAGAAARAAVGAPAGTFGGAGDVLAVGVQRGGAHVLGQDAQPRDVALECRRASLGGQRTQCAGAGGRPARRALLGERLIQGSVESSCGQPG
jgi:hypothetical protein